MELSSVSISNSVSKEIAEEEMTMSLASLEDAAGRLLNGSGLETLSNERILAGDEILKTYTVVSDAIYGGMGSVWKVHHKNWNADLAMKRPQPKFFAEGSRRKREEFVAECENWIRLGLHPNIVSCFYVRDISGVPSVFSEWMDGGSLKDRIQDGSLYKGDPAEVRERILDIAIQAARGLAYSHTKALLHQDMKPGNLLLTAAWDAKVADFGLAKARAAMGEEVTGEQVRQGAVSSGFTPAYCPAEQAEGRPAEPWMDVYAWALTLLEMYAGNRMWESGADAPDMIGTVFRQCRVSVPEEIQILIGDCLERRCNSFAEAEQRLLDIYLDTTGNPYERPDPETLTDTSDTLNNRALSYLDLGREDQAQRLWEEALQGNPNHLASFFNRALFEWRSGRTSGEITRERLLGIRGQTADQSLFPALLEQIDLERKEAEMQAGKCRLMEFHDTCVVDYGAGPDELFFNLKVWGGYLDHDKETGRSWYYISSPIKYVTAVCVTPDGTGYAVAGREGLVEVYDIRQPGHHSVLRWRGVQPGGLAEKELDKDGRQFFPHEVSSLTFSNDGKLLFSGSLETGSVLWNADNGSRIAELAPGYAACFDSSGTHLAFGPKDRSAVEILEILPGDCPMVVLTEVYDGLQGDVMALRFMEEDRELLVSCMGGAVLRIGEKGSGPVVCGPLGTSVPGYFLRGGYRLTPYGDKVYPGIPGNTVIAFSQDGCLGLTIGGGLCDLRTGKCLYTYNSREGLAERPVLSRNGLRVFALSENRQDLHLTGWEWPVLRDWDEKAAWLLSHIADYDQTRKREKERADLLTAGFRVLQEGGRQEVLDILEKLRAVPGVEEDAGYVRLCRESARVFCIAAVRSIRSDVLSEEERRILEGKLCPVYTRPVTVRSGFLKTKEVQAVSFEWMDGRTAPYFPGSRSAQFYTTLSSDHQMAAAEDRRAKGRIVIWDLGKRAQAALFNGLKGDVTGICFSRDNRFVAAAGGNRIIIWELTSGRQTGAYSFEGAYVYHMDFDESGTRLAYAVKKRFYVIHMRDGKQEGPYEAVIEGEDHLHESIRALAFSQDGQRIWSLDEGVRSSLKLWKLGSPGEPVLTATVQGGSYGKRLQPAEDDTKLYIFSDHADENLEFDTELESYTLDYDYEL